MHMYTKCICVICVFIVFLILTQRTPYYVQHHTSVSSGRSSTSYTRLFWPKFNIMHAFLLGEVQHHTCVSSGRSWRTCLTQRRAPSLWTTSHDQSTLVTCGHLRCNTIPFAWASALHTGTRKVYQVLWYCICNYNCHRPGSVWLDRVLRRTSDVGCLGRNSKELPSLLFWRRQNEKQKAHSIALVMQSSIIIVLPSGVSFDVDHSQ